MDEIEKILSPSWLSGLIAVLAGLVLTVGVMLAFSFNNSQIQQQLIGLQDISAPALTLPGQIPSGDNQNSLQNTWPLLGFWAITGLVVYFIVEAGVKTLHNLDELKQELNYVHAHRNALLRTATETLAVRLLALIVWLLFIQLFFKRIIPYGITAAHASASDLHSANAYLYAVLSFSLIILSLHLHSIFLRLVLHRTRVFSNA